MNVSAQSHKNHPPSFHINKSPIVRGAKLKKVKATPKSLVQLNLSPRKQIRSDSLCFLRQKFYRLFSKIQYLKCKDDVIGQGQHFKNTIKQFTLSDLCFKAYRSSDKAAIQEYVRSKRKPQTYTQEATDLQVNTTEDEIDNKDKEECSLVKAFVKRSKYNKRLEPLKASKMSNNIKDYLSVQRISVKDIEDEIISKPKIQKRYNLCNISESKELIKESKYTQITQINLSPKPNIPITTQYFKRFVRFAPPFQTYYYRDFVWKVSYSNNAIFKIPEDYKQKVKFFIGCGNNSNLIKGIMRRRTWFQMTEKVQDAQFIWTQIKIMGIFQQQAMCKEPQHDIKQQYQPQNKQEGIENDHLRKYSVLNRIERQKWKSYWDKNICNQNRMKENMGTRTKTWKIQLKDQNITKMKVHNHFQNNFILGNKKNLFKIMSQYYTLKGINTFQKLPLTFHITCGLQDDEYLKFLQIYHSIEKSKRNNPNQPNAWIVKPGQNSNRGNGIKICLDLAQIKSILRTKQNHRDGSAKTYILQKYIQNPLLYKKRKFDIRHYMMLNCSNGLMKGYWYRNGYIRTTSSEYSLKNNGQGIHLTNDAVQKYLPDYGKYQKSNKITYEELDAFINKQDHNFSFFKVIYPKMKQLATDAIHASALDMDPMRRANNFQIFGLDFMIDEAYNVWLIQINTNPCLETNCPILNQIIPPLIQNTLKICLDPIFPPPFSFKPINETFISNMTEQNNFQIIFDQRIDLIAKIRQCVLNTGQNEQDTFDDQGQDFNQYFQ